MPRVLQHSIGFCTVVEPTPLLSYCAAIQFRFAHSEREYLLRLHQEFLVQYEDILPLSVLQNHRNHKIPHGNLNSPSILGARQPAL